MSVPATHSDTVPPVWRPPEGLVGLAAAAVGGSGAWPGFEPTTQPPNQDEYRWAISRLIPAGHAPVREHYTS